MSLTEEQREIVESVARPILVLAGPGTGKTEVLAHRIKYLLEEGLATKEEVTGIAFTSKAARSMQNRIVELGLQADQQPQIRTLHSLARRMLAEKGSEIGIPDEFLVADDHESSLLIRDAIMDVKPEAVKHLKLIRHKLALLKANRRSPGDIGNGLVKNVWTRYQQLLEFHRALDFEGLISEACRLLETKAEVRSVFQLEAKHLLVDEFQDINKAEYHLVRLLAGRGNGLMVVGDHNQSIYGWRGGDPNIILGFCDDFAGAAQKPMTKCFRCPQQVIKAADEFIGRKPPLDPQQKDSEPVQILDCKSDAQEANFICDWVVSAVKDGGYRAKDIAVLYRGGDIADKIAGCLAAEGIPIERPSPEETMHFREFVACLRLIVDRRDSLALRVCLHSRIASRIGDKAVKKLRDYALANGCSFWEAVTIARNDDSFSRWRKALSSFDSVFEELSASASKETLTKLLFKVAKCLGYLDEPRVYKEIENSKSAPSEWSLHDFVQSIRGLKGEKSADPRESGEEDNDAVLFVTTHSVKGLERKVVFVLGMEKGSFPTEKGDLNEQRRLFYVAMTRAKEKLFLCYAKKREGRSAQGFTFYDRSPYLFEIPKQYKEEIRPN